MSRTRVALLSAGADCVQRRGVRKTTMGDVAATAGVAKATLYNHFRTKDDVLLAVVEAQVAALGERCARLAAVEGLATALTAAAAELAASGPLRRVATDEPALLIPLLVPGEGRTWAQVRAAVHAVLAAGGAGTGDCDIDLVLRWLLSQLLWPAAADQARQQAEQLSPGQLTSRSLPASTLPVQGTSSGQPPTAGLGWPA